MGMKIRKLKRIKHRTSYEIAKQAKVGDSCQCPSCGSHFIKTNYQQAFCKTKEGTICKDAYWNSVDPSKRNNTTRISPASAAWMAKQAAIRQENYDPDDSCHPFDSYALGQD